MAATSTAAGGATRHGDLWGVGAHDWAGVEEQQLPTYEEAIRRVGIGSAQRVLEVGCGTGVFLRAAIDRGAIAYGIDASPALLELAKKRAPEADARVGDMQALPFESDSFDVVAGFNSFFFADDMVAALREAGRVAKPGAPVVIQVWGPPERCELSAMKSALAPFLPAPPPGAPAAPQLWRPGMLERLAEQAGLAPDASFDLTWAYEWRGEEAMARALLSPGVAAGAIRRSGEEPVRTAIVDAMRGCRRTDGSYRAQNEWHYVVARA